MYECSLTAHDGSIYVQAVVNPNKFLRNVRRFMGVRTLKAVLKNSDNFQVKSITDKEFKKLYAKPRRSITHWRALAMTWDW